MWGPPIVTRLSRTFLTYPRQEALASAKWIYSNAQKSANYQFRRRLELYADNPFVEDLPQPGRSDEPDYPTFEHTITKVQNLSPRNSGTQVEGDERAVSDETQEALEWIL